MNLSKKKDNGIFDSIFKNYHAIIKPYNDKI